MTGATGQIDPDVDVFLAALESSRRMRIASAIARPAVRIRNLLRRSA